MTRARDRASKPATERAGRWSRRSVLAAGLLAGTVGRHTVAAASVRAAGAAPTELEPPIAVEDLPTPALLLDAEVFEANLRKMQQHAKATGIGLRPHAKTHKCPTIAKLQMQHGAIGVCVAKVSEAEVLVQAGIDEVLITSPVATRDKIERVIALAQRTPGLQMLVDNESNARDFAAAAEASGATLGVVVGLDTGTRRTGIHPSRALGLVEQLSKHRNLRFDGLQAYAGHVQHISGHAERARRSRAALEPCLEAKAKIERAGFEVGIFTGGGTGTFDIDCDIDGVTDLQVGSYIFMDVQYRNIGDREGELFDHFGPSLFVLTTAISKPVDELITVDAGYKAFANEPNAKPQFRDTPGALYHYGGDEHGIVQFTGESRPIQLGDKKQLIVSHCDPTVNLYDQLHVVRGRQVEEIWPISGRGKSQ